MATTSTASPSAGSDRLSDAQTYEITIEAAGASTVLGTAQLVRDH
jgi:hypothetical protein